MLHTIHTLFYVLAVPCELDLAVNTQCIRLFGKLAIDFLEPLYVHDSAKTNKNVMHLFSFSEILDMCEGPQ